MSLPFDAFKVNTLVDNLNPIQENQVNQLANCKNIPTRIPAKYHFVLDIAPKSK